MQKEPKRIKADELYQWSDFLVGRKVKLISMTNDPDAIAPGTIGTIDHIDHIGTLFVKWDNGRSLGLVPGVDVWTYV